MRIQLLSFALLMAVAVRGGDYVAKDLIWTTQSLNSSESMPCGGHDIGMNVWVEGGDVLFYVQQSGWFDENNTMLKAGRWRLHFDGNPFGGSDFRQRLCLDEGAIYISGGGVKVRLWADVYQPVVFVATESQQTVKATLSYESWRYRDRPVTKAECQQCSYKWVLPKDCTTFADSIKANDDYLKFSHRNRAETVFDFTVTREQLDAIKDSLYNPIGGLLMQGEMQAPGFHFIGTTDGQYASTDFRAWNFRCDKLKKATVSIWLSSSLEDRLQTSNLKSQTSNLKSQTSNLKSQTSNLKPQTSNLNSQTSNLKPQTSNLKPQTSNLKPQTSNLKPQTSNLKSSKWWHDYWQRSWIVSDTPNDSLQTMIRNYVLMRYMLACNAFGEWPTKFNGGLFTFDPVYVDSTMTFTPDYRKWGGGTMTAQNQRLVYWPMLKSGDYDMMESQIGTYYRMLPNAVARTRHYWGHGGASFTEQIENFGLPNPAEYGKHPEGSDPGVERNAWLEYEWDTALEFAMMECLAQKASSQASLQRERGVYSLAIETLRFFFEHYQWQARQLGAKALDEQGHIIIYPGSACETYKMAYNPSSTIAALQTVSNLTSQPSTLKSQPSNLKPQISNLKPQTSNLKSQIPDIPLRVIDGDTCIAPAVAWARIQNTETPQLYPVWPWRIYGLGRPGLQIARNTYWKDPHAVEMRSSKGWKQDNIWATCLGLTDEARRLNLEKLGNGPYRFPAFYDPGFDWAPDHNRGGAGMIGLQEMLLQETPDGELLLFPAWPREWDCRFRLHTLDGRTIEATIRNGVINWN